MSTENTRFCIVHKKPYARDLLIRLVVSPSGVLTPDLGEKLQGRGHWVLSDKSTIAALGQSRLVKSMPSLFDPQAFIVQIDALLSERCVHWISLARRAGQAVAGFEKTAFLLEKGRAGIWLEAENIVAMKNRRAVKTKKNVKKSNILKTNELGQAFGRANVTHAVLHFGELCDRLKKELSRLHGFRVYSLGNSLDSQPVTDEGLLAKGIS